jgi:formylglycine-generating enzyme required for sulfatase activity
MNSKATLTLLSGLILSVSYLSHVHAVTDAELEALEKQIEQQEAEEKKEAEAKAKRKAEERKAVLEKQRLEVEQKRLEEERRQLEEEKRELEKTRQAELERKQQEEEAERQQLAAEEARLKKKANEKAIKLAGEMVDVPGGSYQMGWNEGHRDEKPVHMVTIKPFKMGKAKREDGGWLPFTE